MYLGWRSQERLDIGPVYLTSPAQRLATSAVVVKPNLKEEPKPTETVMDDIKESVRVAAGKAVNALSRTCIRMCDSAQSGVKASEETVQIILPPILDKGKGYSSAWIET